VAVNIEHEDAPPTPGPRPPPALRDDVGPACGGRRSRPHPGRGVRSPAGREIWRRPSPAGHPGADRVERLGPPRPTTTNSPRSASTCPAEHAPPRYRRGLQRHRRGSSTRSTSRPGCPARSAGARGLTPRRCRAGSPCEIREALLLVGGSDLSGVIPQRTVNPASSGSWTPVTRSLPPGPTPTAPGRRSGPRCRAARSKRPPARAGTPRAAHRPARPRARARRRS
jgi:hypothetical protein